MFEIETHVSHNNKILTIPKKFQTHFLFLIFCFLPQGTPQRIRSVPGGALDSEQHAHDRPDIHPARATWPGQPPARHHNKQKPQRDTRPTAKTAAPDRRKRLEQRRGRRSRLQRGRRKIQKSRRQLAASAFTYNVQGRRGG